MPVVLHPRSDFDQVTVKHPCGYEVVLVVVDGVVHGWRNRCPHLGVGLDWGDGRCLSGPNELVCAMHGARFIAETGACVGGPCAGEALTPVPVRIERGAVVADA